MGAERIPLDAERNPLGAERIPLGAERISQDETVVQWLELWPANLNFAGSNLALGRN